MNVYFSVAIGHHHLEDGRLKIIKILLSQGSRLESKNSSGWTALITAAFCGHVDIVMLLVDGGAEIDAKAEDGLTALIVAAQVRRRLFQLSDFYSTLRQQSRNSMAIHRFKYRMFLIHIRTDSRTL